MENETRTVKYDAELNIEAYHFKGVLQNFPVHFHDHYVIGFIEGGRRYLVCNNREYTIEPGDLLMFNPRDNHSCDQFDSKAMDYRCINIQPEVMRGAVFEITGSEYLPYFTSQVVFRSELVPQLKELHLMMMQEEKDFHKEEIFFFLLEQLIKEYAEPEMPSEAEQSAEAQAICAYLEHNYMSNITLDDLAKLTGLSKYYLLRCFTRQKGISPYRYLETIRIGQAKKLLEQGMLPIDVALQTGFSDQSHFTNFFKKLIGLTPKQYMNIYKGQAPRKEHNE